MLFLRVIAWYGAEKFSLKKKLFLSLHQEVICRLWEPDHRLFRKRICMSHIIKLKHGIISLIEDGTLVIGVLTQSELYEKTISNMVECKSRGAYLMGLTTYRLRENSRWRQICI